MDMETLKLITQGGIGAALIAAIVLFLKDRRASELRFLSSLKLLTEQAMADRRLFHDLMVSTMTNTANASHATVIAVSEIKEAIRSLEILIHDRQSRAHQAHPHTPPPGPPPDAIPGQGR